MRLSSIASAIVALVLTSLPLAAAPQRPDFSDSVREALEVLPIQPGSWEGEAWYRSGPGEPDQVQQVERVETRLDGVVTLIEGIGRSADDRIVHHAFATLGWDPTTEEYRMTAWLADGTVTDADVTFEDGVLTWGFQVPSGPQMRYRITSPEPDMWEETGHVSLDGGETWFPFFGMTLHRVDQGE